MLWQQVHVFPVNTLRNTSVRTSYLSDKYGEDPIISQPFIVLVRQLRMVRNDKLLDQVRSTMIHTMQHGPSLCHQWDINHLLSRGHTVYHQSSLLQKCQIFMKVGDRKFYSVHLVSHSSTSRSFSIVFLHSHCTEWMPTVCQFSKGAKTASKLLTVYTPSSPLRPGEAPPGWHEKLERLVRMWNTWKIDDEDFVKCVLRWSLK